MNNKVIKKHIEYIGYDSPDSPNAVEFEIAGLKMAISKAEEKILSLEQSKILAKIELENRKQNG